MSRRSSRSPSPIPVAMAHHRGSLKTNLFGCCSDIPICIQGIFCLGCLAAENWAAIRRENCTCWHCIYVVSPVWTRQEIRKRRGMPPNFCADCMIYSCCSCLAICQDAREIKELQWESMYYH